jgi:hypothetical protein
MASREKLAKVKAYIVENCLSMSNEDLGINLGMPESAVKFHVRKLGVSEMRKKSPEYQNMMAERKRARNKTMFKKGSIPHNSHPEMKVSNVKGWGWKIKYKGRLMPVNYAVWEAHHKQPVPKGMVLKMIDGNQMNLAIDNMELITRYQNLIIAAIMKVKTSDTDLFLMAKALADHKLTLKTIINEK